MTTDTYNTEREKLVMPEYGRGVLSMVKQLKTIPDREKRSEQARAVVKTMEILNPQVRTQEDYEHRLWDCLFIIAGFDLDIDAPYPCPSPAQFDTKPVPIPMKGSKIKAAHYGRNIERMLELIAEQPEGEVKLELIRSIATYMRQQYLIWNKDNVAEETIFADIEKLSEGKLKVPEDVHIGAVSNNEVYSRPGMGHQNQKRGNFKHNRNNRKK